MTSRKIKYILIGTALFLLILVNIFIITDLGDFFFYSSQTEDIRYETMVHAPTGETPIIGPYKTDILREIVEENVPYDNAPIPPREILERFRELHNVNPDLIGWIYIPGTNIDFPLMQTSELEWDWNYYLNRNFYHVEDGHGVPYIWPHHDIMEDDLIFIYGHNMPDGSMFAELAHFRYFDFFEAHPIIVLDTIYEEGSIYQVAFAFQVLVVPEEENQYFYDQNRGIEDRVPFPYTLVTNWENEEAFDFFIELAQYYTIYDTGTEVRFGDRIIALWTCTTEVYDGLRLGVVAVRQ
ncbi:MAG: class B sortase [Lachnospiraceae bacterium]|nr:class B sortase [Lachnospiraceae bacterium]